MSSYIRELCDQLERNEHDLSGLRGALKRIAKDSTKWSDIKDKGTNGFNDNVKTIASELLSDLKRTGLFIVPVGELEAWIDLGTKKKNKWIIKALDAIHGGKCPHNLKFFVGEILMHMGENIGKEQCLGQLKKAPNMSDSPNSFS